MVSVGSVVPAVPSAPLVGSLSSIRAVSRQSSRARRRPRTVDAAAHENCRRCVSAGGTWVSPGQSPVVSPMYPALGSLMGAIPSWTTALVLGCVDRSSHRVRTRCSLWWELRVGPHRTGRRSHLSPRPAAPAPAGSSWVMTAARGRPRGEGRSIRRLVGQQVSCAVRPFEVWHMSRVGPLGRARGIGYTHQCREQPGGCRSGIGPSSSSVPPQRSRRPGGWPPPWRRRRGRRPLSPRAIETPRVARPFVGLSPVLGRCRGGSRNACAHVWRSEREAVGRGWRWRVRWCPRVRGAAQLLSSVPPESGPAVAARRGCSSSCSAYGARSAHAPTGLTYRYLPRGPPIEKS